MGGNFHVKYGTVGESTKWQAARDYLTSFAGTAGELPRLVFYAFSTGGGMGADSAAEIQVPAGSDLGQLEDRLARFADAGFDDAVVLILPGGPEPGAVRRLVRD